MTQAQEAPYGSWKSPITSELIVKESVGLGQVTIGSDNIYWIEMRPSEGGRQVIVRRDAGGNTADLTPPEFNARTRVHEYGGGDYCVHEGTIYFSNFADQQLFRQAPNSLPELVTGGSGADMRYADAVGDAKRNRLICVREDHAVADREAVNTIAAVATSGGVEQVLVSGHDFYSSPRISPNGSRLAWLAWNHPDMPWDGCELWIGKFDDDGAIVDQRVIAGGPRESIFQPEWSPGGVLHFVSDRTGWWNIYRADEN